jgi:hypothetical protein
MAHLIRELHAAKDTIQMLEKEKGEMAVELINKNNFKEFNPHVQVIDTNREHALAEI